MQKYEVFMHDVQSGNITLESGKTILLEIFAISLEMHWILLKRNAINANVLRVALYLTPIGKHTANNETRRICYQVNGCFDSNIVSQCIESSKKNFSRNKREQAELLLICYLSQAYKLQYTETQRDKHKNINSKRYD